MLAKSVPKSLFLAFQVWTFRLSGTTGLLTSGFSDANYLIVVNKNKQWNETSMYMAPKVKQVNKNIAVSLNFEKRETFSCF